MAMGADGVSGRAVLREWKPLPKLGGLRASLAEAALLCVSSPPFLPALPSFPSAPSNRPSRQLQRPALGKGVTALIHLERETRPGARHTTLGTLPRLGDGAFGLKKKT